MAKFSIYRGFTHEGIRLNRGENLPDSLKANPDLCESLYKKGLLARVKPDGTIMRWLVPVYDFKTVPPHAKRDYAQHLLESGQIDPLSVPREYRDEDAADEGQVNKRGPGRPKQAEAEV